MEANNFSLQEDQKRCFFCKRIFEPYPTVGNRQYVCRRKECQAFRQKLNERDWHERNPVNYKVWYQIYYKAWRQKHPDYQKRYRQQKKTKPITDAAKARINQTRQSLKRLLKDFQAFQAERRKQLKEQEQQLIAALRAARTGQLACGFG